MTDMLFQAFSAWNQVLFIIGGIVCAGLALLILAATVQDRRRCVKVRGKIVAVRCGGAVSSNMARQLDPPEEESAAPKESFGAMARKNPGAAALALLFAGMIIFVPLALFAGGAYFGWSYLDLAAKGYPAQARVTDIKVNSGGDDGPTYSMVVSFKDTNGNTVTATDRIGTGSRPEQRVGGTVGIFYDPQEPGRFVIDDFWHNMALPFGLMGISGFTMFFLFLWPHIKGRDNDKKKTPGTGMMEAAGRFYHPVYEYVSQDGQTMRAHTMSGSNALADKMPGKEVTLLVDPDEPWKAEQPGMLWIIFFLAFGAPGAFLLYNGFVNYESNIFTFLIAFAFIAFFAFKIAKGIKPRAQWEKPSDFKARRREKRRQKYENPPGHVMDEREFKTRLAALDRYTLICLPFMVLIALALLGGGHYLASDAKRFSLRAQSAEGEIAGVYTRRSTNVNNNAMYYPAVTFTTAEGRRAQFEDRQGSNPPAYQTGQKVRVLYDPANPKNAKIDRGWFNNFPALALYGFGALMLWLSLRSALDLLRRRRRAL